MSIPEAESYAAVRHLVTDVEVLSREERNHVLWYACDGGDLSMVKSVIRAGCDVDHFHRGHTPLMMASIGGHDVVVKELILAGCKVDLRSSKCSVGWFKSIAKMTSTWLVLVVWAVVTLFMIIVPNAWVQIVCHVLAVLTIALHFLCEESFKISKMLRVKSWMSCMACGGILPAVVLAGKVVGTATEAQAVISRALVAVTVIVTVIMAGIGFAAMVKEATNPRAGRAEIRKVGFGISVWVVVVAGTVVAVAILTVEDSVETVVAVAGMGVLTGLTTGAVVAAATLFVRNMKETTTVASKFKTKIL